MLHLVISSSLIAISCYKELPLQQAWMPKSSQPVYLDWIIWILTNGTPPKLRRYWKDKILAYLSNM